jgi:Ni/Fe-hydrogenase subunit HybB-like protein
LYVFTVAWTIWFGIGTWNLNRTIGWGWDITNFVWWIGIGHAGTLISAILLLFRQRWRTGVNRAAEAMTIFAVMCAGQFPLIHMGRLWLGFFIFPYPNTRGPLWVNFNSPLLWDVFAISTYFTVSLAVLVLGFGARPCHDPRPSKGLRRKIYNAVFLLRMDRRRQTLAALESLSLCWPVCPRRWYFRCTPSYPSTLPPRSFPAGTLPSSRPTSWRAPSSPGSPWCKP